MAALVAKSYQNLEQVSEVYSMNGRQYVKVRMKNGSVKQVRAYSEAEYNKYNPEVKIIQPAKSHRETFGFGEAGYIWIFKGDTYSALDWFRFQPTKYARMLGWYLGSNEELPSPLPAGVEAVKLYWKDVCDEKEMYFKPEDEVRAYVDTLIFEDTGSNWVGNIKERLTLPLTCNKVLYFDNDYGRSTLFTFTDDDGNIFTWTTSTVKDIKEKYRYMISGTVAGHETYRNQKQTKLQRCKIIEELGHYN